MSPVGRKPRGSAPFPTIARDGPRPAFHGLCQPGKTHACTRSAALPAHASRGKAAQTAQVKDARRGSCARSQPADRGPSRNASHPGTRGRAEIAAGDTVENSPVRGRPRYPLIGGNSVSGLAGTRGHPARTVGTMRGEPRCDVPAGPRRPGVRAGRLAEIDRAAGATVSRRHHSKIAPAARRGSDRAEIRAGMRLANAACVCVAGLLVARFSSGARRSWPWSTWSAAAVLAGRRRTRT